MTQDGEFNGVKHSANNFYAYRKLSGLGDLLTSESGLFKVDYKEKKLIPLFQETFLKGKQVRDIAQSNDGKIWLSVWDSLIRYDPKQGIAELIEENKSDENSLPSRKLSALYLSKENMLWIGSKDKGLIKTNLRDYGFSSFSTFNSKTIYPREAEKEKSSSFQHNMIWSIHRDNREVLWIGNYDGLSRQEKGESTYENIGTFTARDFSGNTKQIDLSDASVMSIGETNGYLWFGTWGGGLIRYSPESKEALIYSDASGPANQRLSGNVIRLLLFDKKRNSLWVGTRYSGLNQIDLTTGEIHHYQADLGNINALSNPWIRGLYLDKNNRLWVGTGGGVTLFDDKKRNFKRIQLAQGLDIETPVDVRGLYQSDEKTLWAASIYGLDRVNIETLEVEKRYLEKDGLSRSALYSIVPDDEGRLWISTIRGLTRFDPNKAEFKTFFVDHNLQSNEFNFNAAWKEKDGSIILGGTGGITAFHPAEVNDNYEGNKPVILEVKGIDSDLVEQKMLGVTRRSIVAKDAFTLAPNQRSVVIDFTIPKYAFSNNVRYEYRLVGNEEKWSTVRKRDVPIRYTNLKPRPYVFEARAVDDSAENNEVISIRFALKSYVWEHWWFWLCALFFLGVLAFYLGRIFLSYRLEKRVSSERRELYQMVVHDLGPNLQRSEDIINSLKNEPDKQQDLLTDLNVENQYAYAFVKQLRSLSAVEGFDEQEKNEFFLEDVIDESLNIFKETNERIKLEAVPEASVFAYDKSIQFVLRNLVSNALKYSKPDAPVFVKISLSDSNLLISVTDQGIGIKDKLKEKVFKPYERGDVYKVEGLGLGLTLVKKIVNKYRGEVVIENNVPHGSVIRVTLRGVVIREKA